VYRRTPRNLRPCCASLRGADEVGHTNVQEARSRVIGHLRKTTKLSLLSLLGFGVAACDSIDLPAWVTDRSDGPNGGFAADAARSAPRVESIRSGVVYYDPERAYGGYTLYSHRDLCAAELVDMDGNVVKSWRHLDCGEWSNAELLPNGDLMVTGSSAGKDPLRESGYLLRMSWDGSILWETPLPQPQDVARRSDGALASIYSDWRPMPEWHRRIDVRDQGVALVSRGGEVVERKSLYDALTSNPSEFTLEPIDPSTRYGSREIDLLHVSSLAWVGKSRAAPSRRIFDDDNLLVTVRHQDTVAVIDWPTMSLLWAWGRGEVSRPHAATALPSGRILVFDNGLSRDWSRVVEVDPETREIVWEYRAPSPSDFFTPVFGGHQRLPNGNTLITNSHSAQIFEITAEGEFAWEFFGPHKDEQGNRSTIASAHRYSRQKIDRRLGNPPDSTRDPASDLGRAP